MKLRILVGVLGLAALIAAIILLTIKGDQGGNLTSLEALALLLGAGGIALGGFAIFVWPEKRVVHRWKEQSDDGSWVIHVFFHDGTGTCRIRTYAGGELIRVTEYPFKWMQTLEGKEHITSWPKGAPS